MGLTQDIGSLGTIWMCWLWGVLTFIASCSDVIAIWCKSNLDTVESLIL